VRRFSPLYVGVLAPEFDGLSIGSFEHHAAPSRFTFFPRIGVMGRRLKFDPRAPQSGDVAIEII
jgi:hypothetical protein